MANITANNHTIKVAIMDEGEPYANDHPYKVEIEGSSDFATKEDIEELNRKIEALSTDLSYKGSVEDYAHLPQDASVGDVYTTADTGTLYVWDGTEWVALNEGTKTIVGSGAPTTSTEGVLGQAYLDSTTGKIYYLSDIQSNPTSYVWNMYGPNVVQTTGTSQVDVMSQNAVTSMVFNDPSVKKKIAIGDRANVSSGRDSGIAIGYNAHADAGISIGQNSANYNAGIAIGSGAVAQSGSICVGETAKTQNYGIAIGAQSTSTAAQGAIALGAFSVASTKGEMNIGSTSTSWGYNNSNYRLISGVYDGQSTHDAATVGQLPATLTISQFNSILETA